MDDETLAICQIFYASEKNKMRMVKFIWQY